MFTNIGDRCAVVMKSPNVVVNEESSFTTSSIGAGTFALAFKYNAVRA